MDSMKTDMDTMKRLENEIDTTSALERARRFIGDGLIEGRCHDTWSSTIGAPPVRHSHSVFLAYFVTRALAVSGGVQAPARSMIREYLTKARKGDAYGYDFKAPPDADDTAFAQRTRILLGDRFEVGEIERSLAQFAFRESWLTFASRQPPAAGWTLDYRDESSLVGMHPEVHLNVLALLRAAGMKVPDTPALPHHDGLLANYHYPSRFYASWLLRDVEPGQSHLDRATAARQQPDGSWEAVEDGFSTAQETALALLSLSDSACSSDMGWRGAAFLVAHQRSDGSWPGGVLWNYSFPKRGTKGFWQAQDSMSMMTTSLALVALRRVVTSTSSH